MPTLEAGISSSADDAEERASGSMKLTSSDLELVDDGTKRPDQTVGLRFNDLNIPQGAVITRAYLQFQVDETDTGAVTLQIHGEDADNALAFTRSKFNVSSRQTTDATVTWSPPAWTTVGEAGPDQQTTDISDISSIIQEIVNRPGWTANNSIALLITGSGERTAESFNGVAPPPPLLPIEHLPPGAVNDPVTFNAPADSNTNPDQIFDQILENSAAGTTAGALLPRLRITTATIAVGILNVR